MKPIITAGRRGFEYLSLVLLRRIKIRYRLFNSFVLLSLLPLLISGYISYTDSTHAIALRTRVFSSEVVRQVVINVQLQMAQINARNQSFALSEQVQRTLSQRAGQDPDPSAARLEMVNALIDAYGALDFVDQKYLLDQHNHFIDTQVFPQLTRGVLRFVDQAPDTHGHTYWGSYDNGAGQQDIGLIHPIISKSSNQLIGHLFLAISAEHFSSIFDRVDLGLESKIFIVDASNGRVIVWPRGAYFGAEQASIAPALQSQIALSLRQGGQERYVSYLDRSQAKIWAAYARIPNTSWYVISSVPESKLTAEAQSVRNKMLLIGVLCLLMSLAFAAIISYSIAAPLNKLVDKMQHGSGSVGPYPRSQHGDRAEDELDRVGHSYDIMHDAVNRKIEEIKQMNASLERMVAERTRELSLANEKLTQLASYDALTGLPNRNLLDDRLQRAMVAALRNHHSLALMFIDLDKFKPINDLYGHDIGDLLLKEAAERIAACLREADTVSRIGGDEFIVLLPLIEQAQAATTVAEKLRQALCRPFALANRQLRISASIGIALYPQHGDNERALMKSADMAMYQAKDTGGNAVTLGAEPPWHERAN